MKTSSKSKVSRKLSRKCCICGGPTFSPKSNHCYGCHQIALHMFVRNIHGDRAQEIWDHVRKYGQVCFYTKIRLDMTNPKSPFYFVFDHMIPGEDKVVLTFALLNEMKSDMIPKEFWYSLAPMMPPPALPPPSKFFKGLAPKCLLCGKPVYAPHAMYCDGCHQFVHNMDNRRINNDAAKKILKHVQRCGFFCEYTQTPLNMTDYKGRFYYEFDHTIPGDKRKVALTFSLLHEMKSEMTLKEFKYYIGQFANFLRTGAKIKKRELSHWYRLAQ